MSRSKPDESDPARPVRDHSSIERLAPLVLILAGLIFAWVLRSPLQGVGSDPRGTLVVGQALLETGSMRLDDYVGPGDLPSRNLHRHPDDSPSPGRVDYFFPMGAPLTALPAVAIARALDADLLTLEGESKVQKWLAAISVSGEFLLLFILSWQLLEVDPDMETKRAWSSIGLALVGTLGSGLISTLGKGFWSSNAAALWGTLALVVLAWGSIGGDGPEGTERGRPHPWSRLRIIILGTALFMAALSRPTMAILACSIFGLLLWRKAWRSAIKLGLVMALPTALFIAYSLRVYGQWVPPYYVPARLDAEASHFWEALLGNLISPGRGLLLFSPWIIVLLLGTMLASRRFWRKPRVILALAWPALTLLAASKFPHWWGGHSYGPRTLVECMPGFVLLAGLLWQHNYGSSYGSATSTVVRGIGESSSRKSDGSSPIPAHQDDVDHRARSRWIRTLAIAFGITALFSVWVHAWQGLYNINTVRWNGGQWGPELGDLNIDDHPEYLWTWRYPQFLASGASIKARYADFQLEQTPALAPIAAESDSTLEPRLELGLSADGDPRHFENFFDLEQVGEGASAVVWRWSDAREQHEGGGGPALIFKLSDAELNRFNAQGARLRILTGSFEGRPIRLLLNGRELGHIEPHAHFEPMWWEMNVAVRNSDRLQGDIHATDTASPPHLGRINRLELWVSSSDSGSEDPSQLLGAAFQKLEVQELIEFSPTIH